MQGYPEQLAIPHLNLGQNQAVSSSIGRDITFIWGPPGTGKTHTIGTLAEQLFGRGRSVLLVSHTNTAVDQALLHISDTLSSPESTSALLDAGKVLRVGDPRDERLAEQPRLLLDTHVERRSAELAQRRHGCEVELQAASDEAIRLSRLINLWEWVHEANADIEAMARELEEIVSLEHETRRLADEHMYLAASSGHWSAAVAAANRVKERLVQMDVLRIDITAAEASLKEQQSVIQARATMLSESESRLQETTSVNRFVRAWRQLPKPEEQRALVARLRGELNSLIAARGAVEARLRGLREARTTREQQVAAFVQEYRGLPNGSSIRLWACPKSPGTHGTTGRKVSNELLEVVGRDLEPRPHADRLRPEMPRPAKSKITSKRGAKRRAPEQSPKQYPNQPK